MNFRMPFAALALLVGTVTGANAASPPDPTTVSVPDLGTADARVAGQGYKFFIFHKPSVSFAQAHADIAECRSFLEVGGVRMLPGFVPWVEPSKRVVVEPAPVGLAYAALAAIIIPKMERGIRNNKLRRCMEPRGYSRYAIPEAAWTQLNEGDEAGLIAMQAKLASGPRPNTPQVTE